MKRHGRTAPDGAPARGAGEHAGANGRAAGRRPGRGIYWILGGLIVTGIVAGYSWVRSLFKV